MSIPSISVEVQGSRIALRYKDNLKAKERRHGKSKRGAITAFSRKSRKRLLDLAASFDLAQVLAKRPVIFITLTYGQNWPDAKTAKKHLDNFKKRIARFAPEASGIWRLEFQKRGAPHFHFILFNMPYLPKDVLAEAWGEIVGREFWDTSGDLIKEPFTRIEALKTPRRAFYYLSKYVAKLPEEAVLEDERSEDDSGFNTVPYFTAEEWIGRFWGILNRDTLPFAELLETVSDCDETVERAFFQFRRLMAKKWKAAKHFGKHKGATIYAWDNAECWLDAWIQCLFDAQDESLRPRPNLAAKFHRLGY